jgi:hypothetical protein
LLVRVLVKRGRVVRMGNSFGLPVTEIVGVATSVVGNGDGAEVTAVRPRRLRQRAAPLLGCVNGWPRFRLVFPQAFLQIIEFLQKLRINPEGHCPVRD